MANRLGHRLHTRLYPLTGNRSAADFTLDYIRSSGFREPLLFSEATHLGMTVPDAATFTVADVARLVGPGRRVDVLDVGTQEGLQMTMRGGASVPASCPLSPAS